ncbi:hypothetical protein [Pseudomonas caspiana]|uniref:Uncharacterized protein n=1 Tax=Pseudomonas caspiana TaxID=1451454 RepID=A0A1Y3NWQ3_9PSED|nr:hypothetical protein [Pseudomonas caspiana]OUM71987.1 hypothetical protein AUC60_20055 [Pseudomonas caspiana]
MNKVEIESELLGSRKWFDSNEAIAIKGFLAREFGGLMSLFVLHHHFGQSEEHYVVMIDGKYIAELEVSNSEIVGFDKHELANYLKDNPKMPRLFRFRIETAQALSGKSGLDHDKEH